MKERGIYWLASYPKSGNTWFRFFLCNLLSDNNYPVTLNELSTGAIASSREWLDNVLGFDSADLYSDETRNLRPEIYQWTADNQEKEYSYHKIHDACVQLDSGKWLVSEAATAGAIYIIRNPLDVAISLAHHTSCTVDEGIEKLNDPLLRSQINHRNQLPKQVDHCLSTWSEHVRSWVDNPAIDTYVLRYEDMKYDPLNTFTHAADFLKLSTEANKINDAISFSNFDFLQAQEQEIGFKERPPKSTNFFRKGVAGDWQGTLTVKQIDRVIEHHHEVMQRFGYLDATGTPRVM